MESAVSLGQGVLSGIRVLDFGRFIAGPYCAALLAEFGAEVIRIERRGGGEDRFILDIGEGRDGALFNQMNRNKLSITLEPTTPDGRDIVRKLVRTADVVVANLPPETLRNLGLDYDTLRKERDDIILVASTAYGSRGPWGDRVGFDGVGQAMSGAAYISGSDERPSRSQAPFVDFGTALHAANGVLLALLHRQKTGQGQLVETSLLGTSLMIFGGYLVEEASVAPDRKPGGNSSPSAAPADIYPTRDGWIFIQVLGNPLFRRWAKLMERPELADDPRFKDDALRVTNNGVLDEITSAWTRARTSREALDHLAAARVPAGPVLKPRETLDHPQVQATGLLTPTPAGPNGAETMLVRVPLGLSATPGEIRHAAPTAGEHTDYVLTELGYSAAQIADLRAREIV